MSSLTEIQANPRPRDVQTAEIGSNTLMLRSRTWDRLKFEVEYARQKGTTANSYLIQAEKSALLDPPGESFTDIFFQELGGWDDLDYVILSHVNPNRMVTLAALIERAPQVKIVCSRPGANALKTAFPQWEEKIEIVRTQDTLDLGNGHQLQFITVPTPRWPDGIFTYDAGSRILFTDKFFGVHLCSDAFLDEDWKQLDSDRHYYFDCLHAGQTKQVEAALDKLAAYPAKCYAPAHGPLVRYSFSRFGYDYRTWCQQQKSQEFRVALLYASAYGNTTTMADAIAQGLIDNGLAVESMNCEQADAEEITRAVRDCDGFIIGSPTLGGHAPIQIETALGIILSAAAKTKLAGVFGSFGWSGEAIDLLESKLLDANYRLGFPPLRVRFSPTEETLQQCREAGAEFARTLKKKKKLQSPRQAVTEVQIDRTEQAVGRIIGSLCVVSTRLGDTDYGVLTSLVSQATFNPPGLMLAVAENQNADLLAMEGDRFILNILKEGRDVRKHFSYQPVAGENPFAQLATRAGDNGCLVLSDALAYLECTVRERMECGDRWLIYATIDKGDVLEATGVTAIAHRKSGGSY